LLAGERRVVDLEGHADRRLVDGQRRQLLRRVERADGVGNAERLDAVDGDDVAGLRFLGTSRRSRPMKPSTCSTGVALLAVAVDHADRRVGLDLAALDAADADHADEVVVVELADPHLERAVRVDPRRFGTCFTMASNSGSMLPSRTSGQAGVAVQAEA
jgi:hypothetical protein